MHEMTIVAGILRIVEDQARAAGARTINTITLDIGDLAGIETDALRFSFQAARRETMAAEAELVINRIPGRGRCPECGAETLVEFHVAVCPECGQGLMDVFQGRELKVKSINVD